MSKFKIHETEIESRDQWQKLLHSECILGVQLYSSQYGPMTCIYPNIDFVMKECKKLDIPIEWRRINVVALEEANRLYRIENSVAKGEVDPFLTDEDLIEKLEAYTQYSHPQPLMLFFKNAVLMDIMRIPSAPFLRAVMSRLCKDDCEPNPDMQYGEIVIGWDAFWDPEKERLEIARQRFESLRVLLEPIFKLFYWMYDEEDVFTNAKMASEFCSYLNIGEDEKEHEAARTYLTIMLSEANTMDQRIRDLITQDDHFLKTEHLSKLEEYTKQINPEALRAERLAFISQMIAVNCDNMKDNEVLSDAHATSLQKRLNKCFEEEINILDAIKGKTALDCKKVFMSMLDEDQIFAMIMCGLTDAFEALRLERTIEELLGEETDLSEALGEERVKGLVSTLLGDPEDFEFPEVLVSCFEMEVNRFSEELTKHDIVSAEHLEKFETEIEESKFRDHVDMDILYKQLEKQVGLELVEALQNGTLKITDVSDVALSLKFCICSFDPSIKSIVVSALSPVLANYLRTHSNKFTSLTVDVDDPTPVVELFNKQQNLTDISFLHTNDSLQSFLSSCAFENLRSLKCLSASTTEASAELQAALVSYIQKHNIVDFTCNWDIAEEHAASLSGCFTAAHSLDLGSLSLIRAFLGNNEVVASSELSLSAENTLFGAEEWTMFTTFLENKENLPQKITLKGDISPDDGFGALFKILETKPSCEHLVLENVGLQSEDVVGLANLTNANPKLSDIWINDASVTHADIEHFLETLNAERKFDLTCHFGHMMNNAELCEMLTTYIEKHHWLVIPDLNTSPAVENDPVEANKVDHIIPKDAVATEV